MARRLNDESGSPAPRGHNGPEPLSDDDEAALHAYYRAKINEARRAADKAKAVYDEARGVVTDLFAGVKSELRIKRKEFEDMLAAASMSEIEFRAAEARRIRLYSINGLPVGAQLTLDLTPAKDTATEQQKAYARGFRAGENGEDLDPIMENIAPILRGECETGWKDGQAKLIMQMGRAEAIIAERAAPKHDPDPEDEPEPSLDDERAVERRSTRRARESLDALNGADVEAA